MSVSAYITSIESSRNKIRNKLVELGMAASNDKLDALASAIENLINQGAVSVTVREGDTYTIPAGYHNGNGTVSGVSGGGSYSLQAKTATPTKKQQNIVPDTGYYGLSGVTVAAIPVAYQDVSSVTATAGDVLSGKVYVTSDGVVTAGSMVDNGSVNATINTTSISYTIPKGYHSGSGKVQIVLENKTVTPSSIPQKVEATSGKVLSYVVVEPIPEKYKDISVVTAKASNVLEGDIFVDSNGDQVEGTMPNKGTMVGSINGLTLTSWKIPAGYHNGSGEVVLTKDIENALAAI